MGNGIATVSLIPAGNPNLMMLALIIGLPPRTMPVHLMKTQITLYVMESQSRIKRYSCQLVVDEALDWLEGKQTKKNSLSLCMFLFMNRMNRSRLQKIWWINITGLLEIIMRPSTLQMSQIWMPRCKLLKTLKSMKLDQNTLVIFTSDNG